MLSIRTTLGLSCLFYRPCLDVVYSYDSWSSLPLLPSMSSCCLFVRLLVFTASFTVHAFMLSVRKTLGLPCLFYRPCLHVVCSYDFWSSLPLLPSMSPCCLFVRLLVFTASFTVHVLMLSIRTTLGLSCLFYRPCLDVFCPFDY